MGRMQAEEMNRLTDLDTALSWHLQSNHYPPIPLSMVPTCKLAIDAYNDGDYQRQIDLPSDILYRGCTTAPASAIVEQHHLDAFVEGDTDADY
jgi:hypothetical protein